MKTLMTLVVDGLSFGMILFLISSGMSITLGVMRVVNLAHCSFAMLGGYIAFGAMRAFDIGVLAALPVAVLGTIAVAVVLEGTLFRWIYASHELGQVLMTIGLAFVMVASVNAAYGSQLHTLPIPKVLSGEVDIQGVSIPNWRAFLVAVSGGIAVALWLVVERTDFGARLRAAVDNPRMARCAGINVRTVFALTFVSGCGLAAIGGVLGTQMLPLEPTYALKHLILVLIVVAVGGAGSLKGALGAALIIGVLDTIGRYAVPDGGGFVLYLLIVLILMVRPGGLVARGR